MTERKKGPQISSSILQGKIKNIAAVAPLNWLDLKHIYSFKCEMT